MICVHSSIWEARGWWVVWLGICLSSSDLSCDISLLAETNKCIPWGFEVKAQDSPPQAEISLNSHISSKNVIDYFITYHNVSVVILISQNGYVNCHGVGSVFRGDAWDGFPCILNGVIITTSKAAAKIKGESCIWNCCVNCPHRTRVVVEGTVNPLQTQCPATNQLSRGRRSQCFSHSQGEAGLSPEEDKGTSLGISGSQRNRNRNTYC